MADLWARLVIQPSLDLVGPEYYEMFIFVAATQMLHLVTFWTHSLIYIIIDMNPTYFTYLRRWKSQPDVFITTEQQMKAIKVALFNQAFVNIPFALVTFYLFKWRGVQFDAESFPTALNILRDFVVFAIVEEIGFYYGHRISHHPTLYARIHKVLVLYCTCKLLSWYFLQLLTYSYDC
jgi:sterol desaturase/sphingolipid hydroxylase (fatty acid hydroxylase superfamily)